MADRTSPPADLPMPPYGKAIGRTNARNLGFTNSWVGPVFVGLMRAPFPAADAG